MIITIFLLCGLRFPMLHVEQQCQHTCTRYLYASTLFTARIPFGIQAALPTFTLQYPWL
jgi:hypothetical protein